MNPQVEIIIVSAIVASSCALLGVFLVLRKMAMMTDAISHTILLGIVISFFLTKSLNSPLLILGAGLLGLLTVYLTEAIGKTKIVAKDSSIGIVFPFLFSVAIILITKFAGDVHLDVDSVLLGELAFVPFDRFIVFGVDIGAKSIYVMGMILLINIIYIILFYKELKIVTFDSGLALVLGFSPAVIHYSLMSLVSITAVGAFEAVGSILVIAFMIGPPASAYLLTDKLKKMIIISVGFGVGSSIIGYQIANYLDVSIAGTIATVIGALFLIIFVASPKRGIITVIYNRRLQKLEFALKSLVFHLYNHEGTLVEEIENKKATIYHHLHWSKKFSDSIITKAIENRYIRINGNLLKLTKLGKEYAISSYSNIISSNN
ncbi:metal ABC transporter permease [Clostridiaceae bacterium M8S5]|nr:metal ABC transporter permease [Clostridiaceae bacterium M8S5]